MDEMPDPTDDPALAAFTEDLRTIAAGPAPEPRAGLLAVMFQGASVPIDSCPGRRKMLVKTFVGSLAAKVALGMGVAAASMTAAGAAGVLPGPAQHAMASVVGATTPFVLPDPSTVTVQSGHDTPTSTTVTTRAGGTDSDGAIVGAAADKNGNAGAVTDKSGNAGTVTSDDKVGAVADNHGACVSAVAGSGGKTVSSVARSDCGKAGTSTSTSSTSTSTTSTTVAGSADRTANSGPGSANSGRGNSGSGSANSGKGNSGKS